MKEFFVSFSYWIAPAATALALWFLVRFVNRHDQFKDSVNEKLDEHAKEVKTSADKMEATASEIKKDALEIKKAMVDFKGKVNEELFEIHKKAVQLQNQFHETASQVKSLCTHISEVQKTVEAHHNSLSLGAKAMHQHREEILNMKSEIKRISENLIIIKDKKPQGGSQNEP